MTGWRAGTPPGMPDWSADLLTTWSRGPLSLTMHNKYIPSGLYNKLARRTRARRAMPSTLQQREHQRGRRRRSTRT